MWEETLPLSYLALDVDSSECLLSRCFEMLCSLGSQKSHLATVLLMNILLAAVVTDELDASSRALINVFCVFTLKGKLVNDK